MIREANVNDFTEIQRLISILEERTYNSDELQQIYNKHLQNDYYFYYVYEQNNQILGVISLLIKETLHHCHKTGEIVELCVDPLYRGQKIGEKLIDHIEKVAVKKQLVELELSSNVKRKDAHRFYERHHYNKDHYNFTKKL